MENIQIKKRGIDIIFFGTVLQDFYDSHKVLVNPELMFQDNYVIFEYGGQKPEEEIAPLNKKQVNELSTKDELKGLYLYGLDNCRNTITLKSPNQV